MVMITVLHWNVDIHCDLFQALLSAPEAEHMIEQLAVIPIEEVRSLDTATYGTVHVLVQPGICLVPVQCSHVPHGISSVPLDLVLITEHLCAGWKFQVSDPA